MRFFQSSGFAAASRVHLDSELSLELERVMRHYLRYLLERELKSAEFLDLLRQRGMETPV
jgi:recombinational DNA repair protein (RecF pathway)